MPTLNVTAESVSRHRKNFESRHAGFEFPRSGAASDSLAGRSSCEPTVYPASAFAWAFNISASRSFSSAVTFRESEHLGSHLASAEGSRVAGAPVAQPCGLTPRANCYTVVA
jgi:hypothetical protein